MPTKLQNTSPQLPQNIGIQSARQQLTTLIVLVSLCNESNKAALNRAIDLVFAGLPEVLTQKEVKNARREVLDLLEASFGAFDRWNFIRSRALRIFGADGLERLIQP